MIARGASAVVTALVLAACGPKAADQRPPYYVVRSSNGMCSDSARMDASGIVVGERGCEERSSGEKVARATPEQVEAVRRAFAALPPPGSYAGSCMQPAASGTISYEAPGKPPVTWSFCSAGGSHSAELSAAASAIETPLR